MDKEWEKHERFVSMAIDQNEEAQKNNNKVHFDTLMDLCLLENAEVETEHQKYKGRVVLRGDVVKDDSCSALFTE